MRGNHKKFFILLAISLSFFIGKKSFSAVYSNADIFLSEISWMGTISSSADEWLELKNNSSQAINIDNWLIKSAISTFKITLSGVIPAGSCFLLERTDDTSVPEIKADQIYTGALSNSGEKLELLDSNGQIVDTIDASNGWSSGDKDTKQTAERQNDLSWTNSLLPGGTPQNSNTIPNLTSPISETPISSSESFKNSLESGDVLISEFIADPDEDESEWIELYNTTANDITLDNWTIADAKDTRTTLSGTLSAFNFFIINSPKGKLNNSGDAIILRDNKEILIDQVSYGDFDDGNINDNAPTTSAPNAIARRTEYYNSFNNIEDFQITSTPTRGAANAISINENEKSPTSKTVVPEKTSKLLISEILPDPLETDYENEFIELYNSDKNEIDLSLFSLENKNGQKFSLPTLVLPANSFITFYRKDTGLVLNNKNETVKLINQKNDQTLQSVTYKNAPLNSSYNLEIATSTIGKNWTWEKNLTPGAINKITPINQGPIIDWQLPEQALRGQVVWGDSSDTFDPENDKLTYLWDFGDGAQIALPNAAHTYLKTGRFKVTLTVKDAVNTRSQEKIINIVDAGTDNNISESPTQGEKSFQIIFNEIYPSPNNSEEEWLEIFNPGEEKVNLKNWQIKDSAKKNFIFSEDNWLEAENYFILKKSQSKLSLNNEQESLQLFDSDNNLRDEIEYTEAPNGQSYARGENDKWFWTSAITPNQENTIKTKDYFNDSQFLSFESPFPPLTETPTTNFKIGEKIKVTGLVSALPGTLASQYFYINGTSSLQIYNQKKDFPALKIGDRIEVNGELSQINREWRLKTVSHEDINFLNNNQEIIFTPLACGEIGEELLGQPIAISGEITSRKSSSLVIDDGTGELNIAIKDGTGINTKKFSEGDYIYAQGILGDSKNGLQLLPRADTDLVKKESSGKVLGTEEKQTETWSLPPSNPNSKVLYYLIAVLLATNLILGVWLFKKS